jgi:uncharacterized protein (DUF305 family)
VRRTTLGLLAAFALGAGLAFAVAQQAGHVTGHGAAGGHAHDAPIQAQANTSAATRAFMAANARMHRDMDIAFTGQADRDFVAGMIPHHQGAIDMARIVLEHGSDPEVRRLAEAVIREQEREIAQMRAILQRLPAP